MKPIQRGSQRPKLFRILALMSLVVAAFLPACAMEGGGLIKLQVTSVEPVLLEKRGEVWFADFGKDVYGNLQISFAGDVPAAKLTVRLGEKLDAGGAIDRQPPGSVNFREVPLVTQPGQRVYRLAIPTKERHRNPAAVPAPLDIGEITPFRYAEIEGSPLPLDQAALRQLFVHAPFDDQAASFESSDAALNAVWDLCKHTMKATTAFGIYIDGERERIPYEADAYINELSHYACDLDPRVAHRTLEHLLAHPTWPTEWSLHMPMMAAADYEATGDLALAAKNYDALKRKLLMEKARPDGLLRAQGIVDWPPDERDGYNNGKGSGQQVGPEINTVVNAFYYHALQSMAGLARALGKIDDARDFEAKAKLVYESFNTNLFNASRGVYVDGEGAQHAALHANMFPLAFGLVPAERQAGVVGFVQSRGMACSVYGAQYLLEALFLAGKDEYALQLMTAPGRRSWPHMIELGSTMTLEAWDAQFKPNLTWNHAWGAAPANLLSRFVLGVRSLQPGSRKILIAPQSGKLPWVRGKVPTARGPVLVKVENAGHFKLAVNIPAGTTARIALPRASGAQVSLDGKTVSASAEGSFLIVDDVPAGPHVFESQP